MSESRTLTGITGHNGTGTNILAYDALGRLSSESGLESRSYEYDHDGNRTKKVEGATTLTTTYDRTDQPISHAI